eukprot:12480075-Alexandrium_andersonii.AAC.1
MHARRRGGAARDGSRKRRKEYRGMALETQRWRLCATRAALTAASRTKPPSHALRGEGSELRRVAPNPTF